MIITVHMKPNGEVCPNTGIFDFGSGIFKKLMDETRIFLSVQCQINCLGIL